MLNFWRSTWSFFLVTLIINQTKTKNSYMSYVIIILLEEIGKILNASFQYASILKNFELHKY